MIRSWNCGGCSTKKDSLAGSRTPLSRDQQTVTGACTNPIYYQGLSDQQESRYLYEKFPLDRPTHLDAATHRPVCDSDHTFRVSYLSFLLLAANPSASLFAPYFAPFISVMWPAGLSYLCACKSVHPIPDPNGEDKGVESWMAYLLLLDIGCSPLAVADN